jgi:hypothetical protein
LWLGHEILLWLDHLDTPSRGPDADRTRDTPISSRQIHYMLGRPTLKRQRADISGIGGHVTLPLPRGDRVDLRLLAWPLALAGALFGAWAWSAPRGRRR